jgi:hypothetical protein
MHLTFLFCFLLVTIKDRHLIIFLFCNIPHEKSRLFPWEDRNQNTGLAIWLNLFRACDFLPFYFSFLFPLLDHYAAHVGRQRALLHEKSFFSLLQPMVYVAFFEPPIPRGGMSISNCLRKRWAGGKRVLHALHVEYERNWFLLIMLAWFCKPRPIRERGMKESGGSRLSDARTIKRIGVHVCDWAFCTFILARAVRLSWISWVGRREREIVRYLLAERGLECLFASQTSHAKD